MTLFDLFPRLTVDNHRVTSRATTDYNCVAWATGDTERWWWPGAYWPTDIPAGDYGVDVLEQAMKTLGYAECGTLDTSLEPGVEKLALYGNNLLFTHAARQLATGQWTSKIGAMVDIEHDTPEDVAGSDYGEVIAIMKRRSQVP